MARLVLHVPQVSRLVKMNGDNTFSPVFVKVRSSKIGRCAVIVLLPCSAHNLQLFLQCEF